VIDEFIWQADFGQSCVNLRIAKVLTNTRTNAAHLDAILDSHHEAVFGRHGYH